MSHGAVCISLLGKKPSDQCIQSLRTSDPYFEEDTSDEPKKTSDSAERSMINLY